MSDPMPESTFDRLAEATLARLVEALGALEELDVDLSQGVLTVKFEDGRRYVINSHRAARQIWMAADASAWHFDWDGARWLSTRSKEELWALVGERLSARLGRPIQLSG